MKTQQNILVTGTSSGFGCLTAQALLHKGHQVFATMRGPTRKNRQAAEDLEQKAAETAGHIHLLEMDVTDSASVNGAVAQAQEKCGHLDVVVNNAGYGLGGFAEAVTDEQFHHQFDVNVFGVQRVIRAVLPGMRQHGQGLIINLSSVMGRIVIPFAAVYTASKWALEGLCESYRYELSGTGIDVTLVEPGGFGTNFMSNMDYGADAQRLKSYGPLANLPDEMWGNYSKKLTEDGSPDPQAVADAIVTLIHTPAGHRPLRTVVDPMMGGGAPETINQTSDQIQLKMFEGMGMLELLAVQPEA